MHRARRLQPTVSTRLRRPCAGSILLYSMTSNGLRIHRSRGGFIIGQMLYYCSSSDQLSISTYTPLPELSPNPSQQNGQATARRSGNQNPMDVPLSFVQPKCDTSKMGLQTSRRGARIEMREDSSQRQLDGGVLREGVIRKAL